MALDAKTKEKLIANALSTVRGRQQLAMAMIQPFLRLTDVLDCPRCLDHGISSPPTITALDIGYQIKCPECHWRATEDWSFGISRGAAMSAWNKAAKLYGMVEVFGEREWP